MNKNVITKLVGGLLAAFLLVAAVGTVTAYAQESTPTSQPSRLNGEPEGRRGGPGGRQPLSSEAIDAAAQALGMSSEYVKTALQSDKTFEYLAEAAGVDIQVVRDAIKAVMPASDGERGTREMDETSLEAAANALGMTTDEVSAALQDGKTLEDLAQEAGVDLQVVRDAIKAVMPAHDGERGTRGMDETSLEAAANALGMTTDEVSAALQDGKTLEDLAEEAGVDIQVVRDALHAVRDTETHTSGRGPGKDSRGHDKEATGTNP